MGPLGIQELVFIFVLALLIFGPKKLPELGRSFGKGMAEFKRASNELRSTFQREMDAIDTETKEVKHAASEFNKDVKASYYDDTTDDYYSDYKSSSSKSSTTPATSSHASDSEMAKTETVNGSEAVAEARNGSTGDTSEAKSGSKT